MRVFSNHRFSIGLPPGHRFPSPKYELLRNAVEAACPDLQVTEADPASDGELALVHTPDYIDAVVQGRLSAAAQREIGFPWSERMVERSRRSVGATVAAARAALALDGGQGGGVACHLAGGTHHAHYDFPSGFCIFNDLAVISRYLLEAGRVGRVLIFDCDVHQGDGTARILADTPEAITVSLHCEKNFPARKAESDWDIPLPMDLADDGYLQVVDDALNYLLPLYQPDLVIYDAGVDVHKDDALGYLQLTDAGLARRDEAVMRHCLGRDIPVVGVIGGGYDKDRAALARRHGILHHSAARVWRSEGLA